MIPPLQPCFYCGSLYCGPIRCRFSMKEKPKDDGYLTALRSYDGRLEETQVQPK